MVRHPDSRLRCQKRWFLGRDLRRGIRCAYGARLVGADRRFPCPFGRVDFPWCRDVDSGRSVGGLAFEDVCGRHGGGPRDGRIWRCRQHRRGSGSSRYRTRSGHYGCHSRQRWSGRSLYPTLHAPPARSDRRHRWWCRRCGRQTGSLSWFAIPDDSSLTICAATQRHVLPVSCGAGYRHPLLPPSVGGA